MPITNPGVATECFSLKTDTVFADIAKSVPFDRHEFIFF
jgi:hypothetical protein